MSKEIYNLDISNHIRDLRKSRGVSGPDLSAALGKSRSWYSKIETGKQTVTVPELYELAEFFGVTPESIMSGSIETPSEDSGTMVQVPIFSTLPSAGPGTEVGNDHIIGHHGITLDELRRRKINPKNVFTYQITGNSMSPIINHGDRVTINTEFWGPQYRQTAQHIYQYVVPEKIYLLWLDNKVLCKYIQVLETGSLDIVSKNTTLYPTIRVEASEITKRVQIVGQVFYWGRFD